MRGITRAFAAAALMLPSCTAPLYETAEIRKGVSWGGGLGPCYVHYFEGPYLHDYVDVSATIFARWGFTGDDALEFQGTVFGGSLSEFPANIAGLEAYMYWKWGLWTKGAGMFGLGFPGFYNIGVFQDIGDLVTFRGRGFYVMHDWWELDLALSVHRQLTERIRCHISGSWTTYVYEGWDDEVRGNGLSAGIGLEFLPGAK